MHMLDLTCLAMFVSGVVIGAVPMALVGRRRTSDTITTETGQVFDATPPVIERVKCGRCGQPPLPVRTHDGQWRCAACKKAEAR